MRKYLCLLFILFLLIGCGPSGGEAATDSQEPGATQVVLATATTEATAESAATAEATAAANDEFSTTLSPATTVAEAAVVREQDWVRGATNPVVTIIEYGDFQ